MRYALISDIHGNMPALEAVLKDAEAFHIDRYLFLGDYYADMPFPNEVVNTIRSLPNACVVRGNKEDYLLSLAGQNQADWIYEQMAPLYWNYRTFSQDNLEYLAALPEELIISDNDTYIRMFHAPGHLFSFPKLKELGSLNFRKMMRERPFTHEDYLVFAGQLITSDPDAAAILNRLPDGIYIFGHSHLQYHLRLGNKLLINPGSCGFPLDFITAAAYTILDDDGRCRTIEERRVAYDIEGAIAQLKSSGLYRQAKPWGDIMIQHLRLGEDIIGAFFQFADQYARQMNEPARPFSNEIWRTAVRLWNEQ